MDTKWIIWQAVLPLTAPLLVWFIVCACRSALKNTPKLKAFLKTFTSVIEEYGWLMYAVVLSLQSGVALYYAKRPPSWIVGLDVTVLIASLLILVAATAERFVVSESNVTLNPSRDAPIEPLAAGAVALAAAVLGYFTLSSGKVL